MTNLLIGIGGFGSKFLRYMHKKGLVSTLSKDIKMLLIDNDTIPSEHSFDAVTTVRELGVIQSNISISTQDELLNYISQAQKVTIFAGIGGSFVFEVLYELMNSEKIKKDRLYVTAISPFSFEGSTKAAIAEATLKNIIDADIGCGLFANDEIINNQNEGIIKQMEAFFDKILGTVPLT